MKKSLFNYFEEDAVSAVGLWGCPICQPGVSRTGSRCVFVKQNSRVAKPQGTNQGVRGSQLWRDCLNLEGAERLQVWSIRQIPPSSTAVCIYLIYMGVCSAHLCVSVHVLELCAHRIAHMMQACSACDVMTCHFCVSIITCSTWQKPEKSLFTLLFVLDMKSLWVFNKLALKSSCHYITLIGMCIHMTLYDPFELTQVCQFNWIPSDSIITIVSGKG